MSDLWVPDTCTLPTVECPTRLAEFDALFATALLAQERLSPTRLRWLLRAAAEPAARDLTARETECCSFFSFTFRRAGSAAPGSTTAPAPVRHDEPLTVDVAVPPAHVAVLDALAERAAAAMAAAGTAAAGMAA